MRQEPVKVFGNLCPADAAALEAVRAVCAAWRLDAEIELSGAVLRLAFEGVFFPADEVAAALTPFLSGASTGKLDLLDLEAWTLTRFLVADGAFRRSTRDLNHVLDYSGH